MSDRGNWLRCARNAWQRLGNMSPEAAMEQYIVLVSDRAPGWMEDKPGVGIFHCSVLFPIMTLTEKSLWLILLYRETVNQDHLK